MSVAKGVGHRSPVLSCGQEQPSCFIEPSHQVQVTWPQSGLAGSKVESTIISKGEARTHSSVDGVAQENCT